MSNEDRGSSPADGPAKVFENETEAFGHLIAGPRDWRGKQADEWLKRRGVDVEGVMLKALPRILERLPAEQVVQAMREETIQGIRDALRFVPEKRGSAHYKGLVLRLTEEADAAGRRERNASARATTAETARDHWQAEAESMARKEATARRRVGTVELDLNEALARAEKAEEQLRKLQESYDFVHEGRGRQRERAEQAERERDEARSELDRCKAFCRERIQEIHQWERWADLSPRGANVDAPPSNAMHAAAEELRAQGASERVGGRCHHCGHYETSLQRAEEKYAHCPSCERHTRWLPVHDGAEGAELGENQWRCESGLVCTFSDATEDGITLSWSDDVAPKHHKLADVTRHGLKEAAERWHAKNRPLLPDECREQGKPPRKMAAGEIRLLDGSPGLLGIGSARENPTIYVQGVGFHHTLHELLDKSEGPFIDTTQRDRAFAWFLTQLLSDLCLTDDGRSVRPMATNEVRDVVTGKGLRMVLGATGYHSDEDSVFVLAVERNAHYCYATENPPADSPFSLPSNRLRVEAFLVQQSSITDSVQRRTSGENPEKAQGDLGSDGAVLPEAHSGRTSRRPYVTTHDDETLLEWWNGDRKLSVYIDDGGIRALKVGPGAEIVDVDLALGGWAAARDWLNGTGRKTEESDGETKDMRRVLPSLPVERRSVDMHAPDATDNEDRADEAGATVSPERPPGIPASATICAEVVDGLGRKVGAWFDGGDVPLVEMWDPDSGHPWSWAPDCESQWMGDFDERMTPSAAAQCRQLYERGMVEQAEIKAWAENMAGFVCDESIDTGAKTAAALAAETTPKPALTADSTELPEEGGTP